MKFLFSLLFLIPFGLLAQPWDLVRCIEQAQNNNLTIKQAELSVEQQKMSAQVAKKQQFPTVNGAIGQNFNFGRSIDPFTNTFENTTIRANNASVSGSGILYAGGRIRNNIQAEQLNLQASELDFKAIQNNIALQVTNAYLSVVFAKEALRIAQERSLRTNEQAERMKK
ncbi:MAG: TolC family protein, partial [Bacteroidia bacterium]